MIFDYFDAAYYINLDSRPDRRDAFERRSMDAGLTFVERFPAICPPPLPPDKMKDPREHFKIGCGMSHFRVIRLAKERRQKRVLIFEDDCTFIHNFATEFPRYVEELKTVDDWDMVFLGGSPEPDYHNPGGACCPVTPNLFYNPGAVWGAHAYGINAQFYDKILTSNVYPADRAFIVFPSSQRRYLIVGDLLACQDEEFQSDLWGGVWQRMVTYQHSYKKYIR